MGESLYEQYPWLNLEYFQEIIRKDEFDNKIVVEKFEIEEALAKGENYGSKILRAKVEYLIGNHNQRTQQFIIKLDLATPELAEVMDKYKIFSREIAVYRDIMPQVNNILGSIGDKTKLAPKVFNIGAGGDGIPRHFVFEDLSLMQYKTADRKVGLSYQQLKLALEKLAKWHAATALLSCRDETSMKNHNYRNISPEITDFFPVFEHSMVSCADQAVNWPGCEKYAEKLYKLKETIVQKAFPVYTRNEDEFNVLTHGDFWVNNIMYKGSNLESIIVDYACGYFGSPGIDLAYLLYTSCAIEVGERDRDLLIQYYHSCLSDMLQKLEYPKKHPTLTDIHVGYLRKGIIGVIFSTYLIPLRLIEDTANADLSSLLFNTEEALEFRKKLFSVPKYKENMSFLLDIYDRKGFLD